ncbi:MAG: T9SS type A sorting domain-containing protein [Saprospiraceae bacterium]|nr:T9SS type A sorting domain-containing protein [Saprospiraceae bacterium]
MDYDGKYSYSDIASVIYDGTGETNIYPNPATSEVNISTTEPTSVQVMDVYGMVLLNRDISDGQNTINLSTLPAGILVFVVGDQRYKVLKE